MIGPDDPTLVHRDANTCAWAPAHHNVVNSVRLLLYSRKMCRADMVSTRRSHCFTRAKGAGSECKLLFTMRITQRSSL